MHLIHHTPLCAESYQLKHCTKQYTKSGTDLVLLLTEARLLPNGSTGLGSSPDQGD